MRGWLKDFSVEVLKNGNTTIFFNCGHSLMGKEITKSDFGHYCEEVNARLEAA